MLREFAVIVSTGKDKWDFWTYSTDERAAMLMMYEKVAMDNPESVRSNGPEIIRLNGPHPAAKFIHDLHRSVRD